MLLGVIPFARSCYPLSNPTISVYLLQANTLKIISLCNIAILFNLSLAHTGDCLEKLKLPFRVKADDVRLSQ